LPGVFQARKASRLATFDYWNLWIREKVMKAFVIATETVNDEAMFAEYRKAIPATIEAFGGKFIVRGGDLNLLEGESSRDSRIPVARGCSRMVQIAGVPEDNWTSTKQHGRKPCHR